MNKYILLPTPKGRNESDTNGIKCDKNKRINEKWGRKNWSAQNEYKKRRKFRYGKSRLPDTTTHKRKKSLIWSFVVVIAATAVPPFCSILYTMASINIYKFKILVLCNGKLPLSNRELVQKRNKKKRMGKKLDIKIEGENSTMTWLWRDELRWSGVKWNGCQR